MKSQTLVSSTASRPANAGCQYARLQTVEVFQGKGAGRGARVRFVITIDRSHADQCDVHTDLWTEAGWTEVVRIFGADVHAAFGGSVGLRREPERVFNVLGDRLRFETLAVLGIS